MNHNHLYADIHMLRFQKFFFQSFFSAFVVLNFSEATDVYAFSMIVYEIFSKKFPFDQKMTIKLLIKLYMEIYMKSVIQFMNPLKNSVTRIIIHCRLINSSGKY